MSETAPDALQKAVIDALVYRTCGDRSGAMAAVDVIFDHGDAGIYGAMCAWAEAVKRIGLADETPGQWVIELDGPDGADIDTAPRGPVFAARFIAAWANDDTDMARDMFLSLNPVRDAELCADALINLLDIAAATVRAKDVPA